MTPAEPERKWTVEEYLAHERQAEERSEFYAGEVFAMSGASVAHNQIVWNLAGILRPQLRKSGCRGFSNDLRVRVSETGLYTYPDLVVACGELDLEDEELDTLLNPTAIVEVLSPSTTDYDHGQKFTHYRTLDSLRVYLLISQAEVRAELFVRQDDGRWLLTETTDIGEVLDLPVIGARLPLVEVYEQVPGIGPGPAAG